MRDKVIFRLEAREEAIEAAEFIAREGSPQAALKWYEGLEAAINSLQSMPARCGLAREHEALRPRPAATHPRLPPRALRHHRQRGACAARPPCGQRRVRTRVGRRAFRWAGSPSRTPSPIHTGPRSSPTTRRAADRHARPPLGPSPMTHESPHSGWNPSDPSLREVQELKRRAAERCGNDIARIVEEARRLQTGRVVIPASPPIGSRRESAA